MMLPLVSVRRTLALALMTIPSVLPTAAHAQLVQPTDPNDAVDRLGRYIRILAASPRDLEALIGAGQAALEVGDPNAALGFFARAEDVSPSNGRVKAGLASSLVMIERPDDALRLFAEAVSLGVPEAAMARDRGLAYDLRGDTVRAQRDYKLALGRDRDDELVRRYALSLGISGKREEAIDQLQPLLRKQDQGAWRARAFILAMTGDVPGANTVARQLMVPAMASAMSPLLTRLATLNAAERAHAVNFGTVPSDGTRLAVQTGDPFLGATPGTLVADTAAAGSGLIPKGEPLGPRTAERPPTRVASADTGTPRRRTGAPAPATTEATAPTPGFTTPGPSPSTRLGQRVGTRIGPVDPKRIEEASRGTPTLASRPTAGTLPQPDGVRVTPPPPVQVASAAPSRPQLIGPPAESVPTSAETPAFEVPKSGALPPSPPVERVVPAPSSTATSRLAGLLEGIERERESAAELPTARELRTTRLAARKKVAELAAQTAAEAAAKKEREEKAAAAKRSPPRLWVQVATGRNESGFGVTWRRIRDGNDAALKGQSAWFAPFRATNRIVVGPMKSAAAARELVNKLAKGGVQANVWSSEAGEDVTRIAGK